MVDNVHSLLKGSRPDLDRSTGINKPEHERQNAETTELDSDRSVAKDDVVLSEAMRAELDRSEFDQAKVERIKEALNTGYYPIDSKRIAESFAAIEKLI